MGQAIVVHTPGGPEALHLEVRDPGEPGPGEALVRVEAAGVNFIDVYHRTGLYKLDLPVHLGLEGAGVIEALGPAPAFRVGHRVAWADVRGSYATHVIAPVARLVRVPEGVDARAAAAVMLQ